MRCTRGELRPGGVIVEGTAGNTGNRSRAGRQRHGFSFGHRHPGYTEPGEEGYDPAARRRADRGAGGPLLQSQQLREASGRLAADLAKREPNGAIWANQFDNVANREGHIATTGPEIWEQTDGKVDGFTCAVGTGGTLAGIAIALKARNKDVKIALADPMGAALYSFYTSGTLKTEGSSITEGIGQGRITKNLEDAPIDIAYQIRDEEAVPIIFDLLEHEGLCLGGSSGINVAGAIHLARELGPGHTVVTILADFGTRYQSKLFNPAFLREKGLPVPVSWMERSDNITPPFGEGVAHVPAKARPGHDPGWTPVRRQEHAPSWKSARGNAMATDCLVSRRPPICATATPPWSR